MSLIVEQQSVLIPPKSGGVNGTASITLATTLLPGDLVTVVNYTSNRLGSPIEVTGLGLPGPLPVVYSYYQAYNQYISVSQVDNVAGQDTITGTNGSIYGPELMIAYVTRGMSKGVALAHPVYQRLETGTHFLPAFPVRPHNLAVAFLSVQSGASSIAAFPSLSSTPDPGEWSTDFVGMNGSDRYAVLSIDNATGSIGRNLAWDMAASLRYVGYFVLVLGDIDETKIRSNYLGALTADTGSERRVRSIYADTLTVDPSALRLARSSYLEVVAPNPPTDVRLGSTYLEVLSGASIKPSWAGWGLVLPHL